MKKRFSFLVTPSKGASNIHTCEMKTHPVARESGLSVARPHISLKARMLGGHAETITRLGGTMR